MIKLVKEQLRLILSLAKFIVLCGGRQVGKTTVICLRMIKKCLENPGYQVMYTTCDDVQARDVYNRLMDNPVLVKNIDPNKCRMTPQKMIGFKNGSQIIIRMTAFPDRLKGLTLDEVILDEVQDSMSGEAFDTVVPALVLVKGGTIILAGQPRDQSSWWYRHYLAGLPAGHVDPYSGGTGTGSPTHETIILPTSKGALFQGIEGKARLENIRNSVKPWIFQRDFECKWITNEEVKAFRADDVNALAEGVPEDGPDPRCTYIISHDLGYSHDYSFVTVFNVTRMRVAFCWSSKLGLKHCDPGGPDDQIRHVQAIVKKWMAGGRGCYCIDSTGGGNPSNQSVNSYTDLYRQRMPFVNPIWINSEVKTSMIDDLKFAIEQRKFTIPACYERYFVELKAYEKRTREGRTVYSSPHDCPDIHDDAVMSLAMVFHAMSKQWHGLSGLSGIGGRV